MSQLPNYLQSHRKRSALSQEELAFLLGSHGGAKISRYERYGHVPKLETALALGIILQTPLCELFAGLHQNANTGITMRAKVLLHRVNLEGKGRKALRRRQTLERIISPQSNQ